jgi:phosphatidyl-myo-inositol alpha-mannosyltransferase
MEEEAADNVAGPMGGPAAGPGEGQVTTQPSKGSRSAGRGDLPERQKRVRGSWDQFRAASSASERSVALKRIVLSIYDDRQNPHYGGGGAAVVYEIAQRLARDHEVTVLTGSYRGSRGHRAGNVGYVYVPAGWAGARGGQLVFHALLPPLALLRRYDLWIESFTPPYSTSFLPLFSRRRPVIGLVTMLSGEDMTRKYRLPFWWIERRGLARYQRFIALNDFDGQIIREQNEHAAVVVIEPGVRIPTADDVARGAESHILYLGRVDVRQKGLDLLLAAYQQARPDLPLIIAGSGTPREERALRALVPRANSRVQLVGHVSGQEKEDLLRDCAFLVLPSRFETFGLSPLEAMSYGKPVVVFDIPRTRWIPEECSVRIPAFEVHALAKAMQRLSTGADIRHLLGHRARTFAHRHDWNVVAEKYRAVVNDVLANQA